MKARGITFAGNLFCDYDTQLGTLNQFYQEKDSIGKCVGKQKKIRLVTIALLQPRTFLFLLLHDSTIYNYVEFD